MPGPEASQSGPGFLLRLEESRAAPAERGPPSYEALLAAFREITRSYSEGEKKLLFSKNAEQIYGI